MVLVQVCAVKGLVLAPVSGKTSVASRVHDAFKAVGRYAHPVHADDALRVA